MLEVRNMQVIKDTDVSSVETWEPEGRYQYIQRCSIENQEGSITVQSL